MNVWNTHILPAYLDLPIAHSCDSAAIQMVKSNFRFQPIPQLISGFLNYNYRYPLKH